MQSLLAKMPLVSLMGPTANTARPVCQPIKLLIDMAQVTAAGQVARLPCPLLYLVLDTLVWQDPSVFPVCIEDSTGLQNLRWSTPASIVSWSANCRVPVTPMPEQLFAASLQGFGAVVLAVPLL